MTAVPGAPATLSAVEVFRARQRDRRATVVIFYRGERSRFCRTWLRRWLSVPALERRLALADTALIFISSQSQGKAYSVAAQSGVPDHLLDRSIVFLGDPQHSLAVYLESAGLLAPVVTNPTGHRAHAWVYDYGMVQPAVVAVAPDSTKLFAWAMKPCFRNAGGKLERPDPWDAWDYIERKLDRFRITAMDTLASSSADVTSSNSFANCARQTAVSSQNPTMAATLPHSIGSRTPSSVAAAAGDAAEAAAAAAIVTQPLSSDSGPLRSLIPESLLRMPSAAASGLHRVLSSSKKTNVDEGSAVENSVSVAAGKEKKDEKSSESVSTSDDDGEFPTRIPHVRSGLSDLATAAMESADASLSSIEAKKARVKFSLSDHVIEPQNTSTSEEYAAQLALRISVRSDETEPYSPDMTALTSAIATGYLPDGIGSAQFDDAASIVSGKSRSVTPQDLDLADSGSDNATSMMPEVGTASSKEEEGLAVGVETSKDMTEEEVVEEETVEDEGTGDSAHIADEKDLGENNAHVGNSFVSTPGIASPLGRGILQDGPGSGRENILDEFEVFDEYVESIELLPKKGNVIVPMFGTKESNVNHSATEQSSMEHSSSEKREINATVGIADNESIRASTVRSLIEKWAGLDGEKFGSVVSPRPHSSDSEHNGNDVNVMEATSVQTGEAPTKAIDGRSVGAVDNVISDWRADDTGNIVAADESIVTHAEDCDSSAAKGGVEAVVVNEMLATQDSEKDVEAKTVPIMSSLQDSSELNNSLGNKVSLHASEERSSPVKETLVKETPAHEVLENNEAAIALSAKRAQKVVKKVEFMDIPLVPSEKEDKGSTPSKLAEDAVVRKMSSGVYTDRPQGGWFVQNIFSRLSKQPPSVAPLSTSSASAVYVERRSTDQSPNVFRVPVEGDPATDKGTIAIQEAREISAKKAETSAPMASSPADASGEVDEVPASEDKKTTIPKPRARNPSVTGKSRSLPRDCKSSSDEMGSDDGKLSRKLSLFAGGLKRTGETVPAAKSRRLVFGRGPTRAGTTSDIPKSAVGPADRITSGLRGVNRRRDLTTPETAPTAAATPDIGEDDATVRRKISLAKLGDAFMAKLSVSYHEALHPSAENQNESRRSSLRFARQNDSADVRRAKTNVGGGSRREEGNEGRNDPSGFGRRLWSKWAKMKS